MGQLQTIGRHKTVVFTDDDNNTNVVYHSTPVVSFNPYCIMLDTGTYFTNTTKNRMNQASNQFNLGYRVFQKNFEWFVDFNNEIIPFVGNRIKLDRDF